MTIETARPMAALPEEDKELLWKAFFAGFMSSGEGYNGEYPFNYKATDDCIASVKENFEDWLVNHARVPEPNWGNK